MITGGMRPRYILEMRSAMAESADKSSVQILNNAGAAFVYFDHASTYGIQGGDIRVELVARTILPEGTGARTEVVATCQLRCGPDAARKLTEGLETARGLWQDGRGGRMA